MDPAVIERVRSVLEESGLSQADFATEIATTPDKLSKSLAGTRKFTVTELSLIADLAQKSLDWVLKGEVEAEWRLAARSLEKDGGALETAHYAVGRFADALEQAQKLDELRPPRPLPIGDSRVATARGKLMAIKQGRWMAEAAVASLGARGQLIDRVTDLAGALEDALDTHIARVPIPPGLNGCALSTESARLIVIGTTQHPAQQRFTLAHECGHIMARDAQNLIAEEVDGGSDDYSEVRANSFAANLLVPSVDLLWAIEGYSGREAFDRAVTMFHVSPSMMYFRFLNEGLISSADREANRWRQETYEASLLRQGMESRLSSERDESLAARIPPRLLAAHLGAFRSGKASARPLANLLEITPEDVIETYRPVESVA